MALDALDAQLRSLTLAEKRTWLSTRIQQELKPFAPGIALEGVMGEGAARVHVKSP